MKIDRVERNIYEEIVAPSRQLKADQRNKTTSCPEVKVRDRLVQLSNNIERTDLAAGKINTKLNEMVRLLQQIEGEKDDIIRSRIAHYFNALKAFIEEALHPADDSFSGQLFAGQTIAVDIGGGEGNVTIQGEAIDIARSGHDISGLSENATSIQIHMFAEKIKSAQSKIKNLRNSLAAGRAHIAHITCHTKGSTELTL
jgi:hypothetical protein